jgi:hypothetical protein
MVRSYHVCSSVMFGAPLLVIAQLLRAFGYLILILDRDLDIDVSVVGLFVIGAFVVEMLGYLDLSYRTRGGTRALLRMLALAPLVLVAVIFVIGFVGRTSRVDLPAAAYTWCYAGDLLAGALALYLVARRGIALAIGAAVLLLMSSVMPRFAPELLSELLHATGLAGALLLVGGPIVLLGVLAMLAGRAVPPAAFDAAGARRSLKRSVVAIAALAVLPIIVLAGGEQLGGIAVVAALGCLLLAAPAYRLRTRTSFAYVAVVVAILAAGAFAVAAASGRRSYDRTSLLADIALLVAPGALLVAAARRRHAIAFGVVAVAAIALHGHTLGLALELAADVVAGVALVAAGRALQDAPTVADVFA